MNIIIVIFLIILICLVIGLLVRSKPKQEGSNDAVSQLLLSQINELSRTIDHKLGESQKEITQTMRYQSSETSRIVADITEKITRLDETNKQVVSFADQLKNLQDILKNLVLVIYYYSLSVLLSPKWNMPLHCNLYYYF